MSPKCASAIPCYGKVVIYHLSPAAAVWSRSPNLAQSIIDHLWMHCLSLDTVMHKQVREASQTSTCLPDCNQTGQPRSQLESGLPSKATTTATAPALSPLLVFETLQTARIDSRAETNKQAKGKLAKQVPATLLAAHQRANSKSLPVRYSLSLSLSLLRRWVSCRRQCRAHAGNWPWLRL